MFLPLFNMISRMPWPGSTGPVVSIWNEFHRPPYGGGNQFLLALRKALKRMGVRIVVNDDSPCVDVHLCNSAWFDVSRLRKLADSNRLRMIQRVDGSIAIARGHEDTAEDRKIYALNSELALATVYQSEWCLRQANNLGFKPVRPIVIKNSVDGSIFHNQGKVQFNRNRKVRLITTSWSDNPRKGAALYKWLDENLDWNKYEYTFVGRIKESFLNIKHIGPIASRPLARILREHDIFVTATQKDACSNSIIEALGCGLPAVYLNDGGSPELVGSGGLCFEGELDIISKLDLVSDKYEQFQGAIRIESMDQVARRYLDAIVEVMTLVPK